MSTLMLRLWFKDQVERLQMAITWRLPKWVIRCAVIRAAVKDEMGNPGDVTALTMVSRFE